METRKKGKKSWFNILSSLQKSKESHYYDYPYSAYVGGVYRVFVGRLNKPATTTGSHGFMFGNQSTIRNYESENHAGVYDFITFGLPWVVESSFRGNWIDREGPRTVCQLVCSPVWVPLHLARATFGMAAMSVVIIPATIYHFSSTSDGNEQNNKPSNHDVDKEDNKKKKNKQHDFLLELQSLNKIEEEVDYWEVKKGSSAYHPVHSEKSEAPTPYYKIISHVKKNELPEPLQSLVQDKKTYKHYVKFNDGKNVTHLHIWKRITTDDGEKVSKKCAYVPSRCGDQNA